MTCEKAIAEICLRACKERLAMTVYADKSRKIQKLIIRCGHSAGSEC